MSAQSAALACVLATALGGGVVGCEGCDDEPESVAVPDVELPIGEGGWYAAVAAGDAPMTRLLDAEEAGWGALFQGQTERALAAFRAAPPATGAADSRNRIGLGRAALELADHFQHLGDALQRIGRAWLQARPATPDPELGVWLAYLTPGSPVPAAEGALAAAAAVLHDPTPAALLAALDGDDVWAARFVQGRLLAAEVPAGAVEIGARRCAGEAPADEPGRRRRFLDCALGRQGAAALDQSATLDWPTPDWEIEVPVADDEPLRAPIFDPALAWGLARAHAALAATATCRPEAPAGEAFQCGLAARWLGDEPEADAAMERFLADPKVDPFPLLAFGGHLDGAADLVRVANGLGLAVASADPSVCARSGRAQPCAVTADAAVEAQTLARQRLRLSHWIDDHPARTQVLGGLQVDAVYALGRANDLAAAYLRADDAVSASAVLRVVAPPLEEVDGRTAPQVAGTWRNAGLQIDAAARTRNAQQAWRLALAFSRNHGAWIGARETIQLWGLGLNDAEGSTKIE